MLVNLEAVGFFGFWKNATKPRWLFSKFLESSSFLKLLGFFTNYTIDVFPL